jgi:hypothetical protein
MVDFAPPLFLAKLRHVQVNLIGSSGRCLVWRKKCVGHRRAKYGHSTLQCDLRSVFRNANKKELRNSTNKYFIHIHRKILRRSTAVLLTIQHPFRTKI